MKSHRYVLLTTLFALAAFSHSASAQSYVLIGWNDLGMHCSNRDFSKIAILPPYNNVHAQLVYKGEGGKPVMLTTGYTVNYAIPGNTFSVGKTNFWTYAQTLFGLAAPLPPNVGLTGNGLSGGMKIEGNGFIATGIPVTPFSDNDLVNEKPYQLIHLEARALNSTTVLASTDVVIPVSHEIGCLKSGCHVSEQAILNKHSSVNGTFNRNGPVLCASCHASNALGTVGTKNAKSLSFRIHDKHKSFIDERAKTKSTKLAACYNCHPGANTRCYRDVMLTDGEKVCQDCHGSMATIASSISAGRRPWLDEPTCRSCHGSSFGEQTNTLYRNSKGHGNLYCSACHGSPHAITPTTQPNDNLQNVRLQGNAGTLSKCTVCHTTKPTGAGPHGKYYKDGVAVEAPSEFVLQQVYPNPVTAGVAAQAMVTYSLPVDAHVTLDVYDYAGRVVSKVIDADVSGGVHGATLELASLPPGVYFCTITAGTYHATNKFVLSR